LLHSLAGGGVAEVGEKRQSTSTKAKSSTEQQLLLIVPLLQLM